MTTKQEQRRLEERKFYTNYYTQLLGGQIADFTLTEDEEGNQWPTFTVIVGKTTYTIELSQDEEGNGPGFLFGLPTTKDKVKGEPMNELQLKLTPRDLYILGKALSIAERVLDAEQDIRFREPSDLEDLRYLANDPALRNFYNIEKVAYQYREDARAKLQEEGQLNESV